MIPMDEKRMKISKLKKDRHIRLCHICGTHEYTITHNGIRSLLPNNIEVRCGPGCPVCVTAQSEIDAMIELAKKEVMICTFGDMLRVPGSEKSLLDAKGEGGPIKGVYSISDSINFAKKNPKTEVVHFAVGFETTAPTTAAVLLENLPENFSIFCSHKLVPPAMKILVMREDLKIDGRVVTDQDVMFS